MARRRSGAADHRKPGRYRSTEPAGIPPDPTAGEAGAADTVDLVVEVWSPGNRPFERTIKRDAYANAGVRYLWEIEPALGGTGWMLIGQQLDHGCWTVLDRVRLGDAGPATMDRRE